MFDIFKNIKAKNRCLRCKGRCAYEVCSYCKNEMRKVRNPASLTAQELLDLYVARLGNEYTTEKGCEFLNHLFDGDLERIKEEISLFQFRKEK